MKLSVIIPTYKPKEYILECLGALAKQTLERAKYEVLIVLNGCCEPYLSQLQSYISSHSELQNVKLLQTDEGGVSKARNMALNIAQGECITFLDDDDFLSATCLEEMLALSNGDNIVCCYPYAFNDGAVETQLVDYYITKAYEICIDRAENKLNSAARKYFAGPCMKLIPRKIIQNRRFDKRFKVGEDSLFMFAISDRVGELTFTSRNAIYYRRFREGSAIVSTKDKKWQAVRNAVNMIKEYSKIYWERPHAYQFGFYLTRVLAAIKTVVYLFFGKV